MKITFAKYLYIYIYIYIRKINKYAKYCAHIRSIPKRVTIFLDSTQF